jgi:hypothetical protein
VLVGLALAVALILTIGHAYWSNASTWTAPEDPPVLGSSAQSRGLHLNDVYLAPARQAAAERTVTDDVLAAIAVDAGPADRLLSVTVAGHRAELLDRAGRQARSGLPVSARAPIGAQPGRGRSHMLVTLPAAQARTGSLLPVTFQFAVRGAVTTSAPVWPSTNWPDAAPADTIETTHT